MHTKINIEYQKHKKWFHLSLSGEHNENKIMTDEVYQHNKITTSDHAYTRINICDVYICNICQVTMYLCTLCRAQDEIWFWEDHTHGS